jgi:hypothetical protein
MARVVSSETTDGPEPQSVAAAMDVLDRHFAALNAGDARAVADTLHFPHYRLAGVRMQVWESPGRYLDDFRSRAGNEWHRSALDFRKALAASADKVHVDVQFTRYRRDGSVLGQYRSLWVVSRIEGRWGAQLRSSFAH